MAFGVISAFANQRVTIGTELALDIRITGNPDHAYIEGLLEGFYTNWKDPTLEVRGAATRLVNNVPFTVRALKGSESPLSRSGVLSVIPSAPVITNPGKQKFVRGIENEFVVKISNSPSKLRASGPWVGMKYASHPAGIRIFGIVPEVSHAIPSAARRIRVTAESGDLKDEADIGFDLINSYIYTSESKTTGTTFYRIQLNERDKSVSSDLRFSTNRNRTYVITADDTYIYFSGFHTWAGNLLRVPINTGNGQSVTATRINSDINLDAGGMDVEGDSLYLMSSGDRNRDGTIKVVNKSDASTIKSFNIAVNVVCRGMAIHGDDLIVNVVGSTGSGQKLQWYDKNTANGATATHTREVSLSKTYLDIAVLGNTLYLTDGSGKTITTMDIETGEIIATYTLPSSLPGMGGITIGVG